MFSDDSAWFAEPLLSARPIRQLKPYCRNMPAVRPDTDVLFLHKNSAHMTDRSARGPTSRGFLPLVFALVFWTGCADQMLRPKLSPPPIAAKIPKRHRPQSLPRRSRPRTRVTNDRLRLASATDIPCEKTATASAAADSSRRSRYAQLEDGPQYSCPGQEQSRTSIRKWHEPTSSIATPSVATSSTAAASPAADSSRRSRFALLEDSLNTPDDARYRPIPPSAYQSPSTIASSSAPSSDTSSAASACGPTKVEPQSNPHRKTCARCCRVRKNSEKQSFEFAAPPPPQQPIAQSEPAKVEPQPDTTPKEFVLDATDVAANAQKPSSESTAPVAEPQPIAESQPIAPQQPVAQQQAIAQPQPIASQQSVAQHQPVAEPQQLDRRAETNPRARN